MHDWNLRRSRVPAFLVFGKVSGACSKPDAEFPPRPADFIPYHSLISIRGLARSPGLLTTKCMAGSVPAHYAATYGHNNIITLLAERDPASLMIQDNAGDTPAHDATSVRAGLLRSENTRCNAS